MTSKNSEAGKKGRAKSPWSKGPHSQTKAAELSYLRYVKRGKRAAKATTLALLRSPEFADIRAKYEARFLSDTESEARDFLDRLPVDDAWDSTVDSLHVEQVA